MNDERLKRLLDEAAPSELDGRSKLESVRPSLHRARRLRRQRFVAMSGVATVALVVGVGFLIDRNDGTTELDVRDTPGDEMVDPDPSVDDDPEPSSPDDDRDAGPTGTESVETNTTTTVPVASSSTSTTSSTTAPPETTTPVGPRSGQELTEVTEGGTATAVLVDGTISIASASPADGWTADTDVDGPDDVRVDFEIDGRRIRVEFDLEDGPLAVKVEDNGADEDDSSGSDDEPDDEDDS